MTDDPNDRLRVGGWLPSRNDSTATQQIAAVPADPPESDPEPAFAAPPPLEPVRVERQRRGRWWFLVVPVAVVVGVVAVALQFRGDDAAIGADLAEQSPRVALPVMSASAHTKEEPSPSAKPSAGSTSTSKSASARTLPTPTASATPTAHRGAVVGIGGRCLAAGRDRPELAVCADGAGQRWSAPGDGTVRVANRCLDVFASGEANGTPVILYQCNRTDAQQWQLRADGTWRNPQSNKCLSTVGGRSDPGTRLAVFDCAGAANQKWTLN